MRRLTQPAMVEISGKMFCLGHGDGLGPVPKGYMFIRKIFHCRFLQILFSMLHPWLAYRLGNTWSRHSRLSHDEQYEFKGEQEPLYEFAVSFEARHKLDYFVFGHYHASVDMTLPRGARLLVLKDWMAGSPYICFDGESISAN